MNDKRIILVKTLVADELLSQIKSVVESFTSEDFETVMLDKISRLKVSEICSIASIKSAMAHKYKSGESLPPLDKAVLLEEHFNIPPKYWVLLNKKWIASHLLKDTTK